MKNAYIIWELRDKSVHLEKFQCRTLSEAVDYIEKVMKSTRQIVIGYVMKITSRTLSDDEELLLITDWSENWEEYLGA